MEVTVRDIAGLLNGEIVGNAELKINRPSRIEDGGEGSISFYANPKYESYVYTTTASALLVPTSFDPKKAIQATLIKVPNVHAALAVLLEHFGGQMNNTKAGVSEQAIVAADAELADDVTIEELAVVQSGAKIGAGTVIHAQAFVGKNVTIGSHVRLYPGARIMHDCIIGDHVTIKSNAVIGGDGFGFAPQQDGTYKKVPQLGNVIIEDNVDIGSNTTVDRGSIGSTIIRKGVKLDNLVQVAHNVEIGENTVIASQAGIAGSTRIGKNCQIGGQVGFVGHITIADGTRIQAQSGIASAVKKEGSALFGSPAFEYPKFLRSHAVFKNLPDLEKRLRDLEKRLKK